MQTISNSVLAEEFSGTEFKGHKKIFWGSSFERRTKRRATTTEKGTEVPPTLCCVPALLKCHWMTKIALP